MSFKNATQKDLEDLFNSIQQMNEASNKPEKKANVPADLEDLLNPMQQVNGKNNKPEKKTPVPRTPKQPAKPKAVKQTVSLQLPTPPEVQLQAPKKALVRKFQSQAQQYPVTDLDSPPSPKKMSMVDWKVKPVVLSAYYYELSSTGVKSILIGNAWEKNFEPVLLICKFDSPNSFLMMSKHEWETLKLYFEALSEFFTGASCPINKVEIGTCELKFKSMYGKPTLYIGNEEGKIWMQAGAFNRLKQTSFAIDVCFKLAEGKVDTLNSLCSGQTDWENLDPQEMQLYAELLRCDSLMKYD